MESLNRKKRIFKWVLIAMPFIIAMLFAVHVLYVNKFNAKIRKTEGLDTSKNTYIDLVARTDDGSSWLKRNFDLNGKKVDLQAQIYDGYIYNKAKYKMQTWELRVNIKANCYLNKAWNGTVEIHQYVDTYNETVQTLNLSDYDESEIKLDYTIFDGDLMIPLADGDYLIYYPSVKYDEMPVSKEKTKLNKMGFILDYLDEPDLTDYTLKYTYHHKIKEGISYYGILLLILIMIILDISYWISKTIIKIAAHEMEVKKSGILSMSDIYAIIYIVDLVNDEIVPVVADEESEKLRPKNIGANEQFQNLFNIDCSEIYKEVMLEFTDLTTIPERMKERDTIVCEYFSNTYGWCRIRFFAMDRVEGTPLEKVVFTIQVINEEKAELENISKRVDEAEMESKSKSTFLANMSHEIRTPINTVLGLDTMILRESKEAQTISYAKDIKSAANMLLSLINGILDFSKMEAGKMRIVPVEYSVKQMFTEVRSMVQTRFDAKNLKLEFNVSPDIPSMLYGDDVRLKQVLLNLLTNAVKYTDEGTVKVSVFGKIIEDKIHILFSVKDTGIGIRDEDMETLTSRFERVNDKRNRNVEGTGIGLNLVVGILDLMDSELKVISTYGEGSEFYFEVDQGVASEEKLGKLEFDDMVEDEDEFYQASFQAPDAKILVVDDNVMNLTVIENLLKETEIHIDTAGSGKKALEMTLKNKYDLIFMDHMMPEMDGVETFKAISEQKENPNQDTPVIVLTANALKGAAEEYQQIGFVDFVPKPVQPDVLESKIMQYLDPSKYKENTSKSKEARNKDAVVELPKIEGMDVAYGLTHTGGMESLLKIMEQFVQVADLDAEELSKYAEDIEKDENANLTNYKIKVHSMKASAGVMGAIQVSGIAAMLERAARNDERQAIIDVNPYFINEWTRLKKNVKDYFSENQAKLNPDGEKKKIETEVLDALLHQLKTTMEAYDVKSADQIINTLNLYGFAGEKQDVFRQLKTAVANLNAEETARLCDELGK